MRTSTAGALFHDLGVFFQALEQAVEQAVGQAQVIVQQVGRVGAERPDHGRDFQL